MDPVTVSLSQAEQAIERSAKAQRLLPPPPSTRSGRAAAAIGDRLNGVRNSTRLMVEDHMVLAPLAALAMGILAGRLLHIALRRRT